MRKKTIILLLAILIPISFLYSQTAQELYKQGISHLLKVKRINSPGDLDNANVKEAFKIFNQIAENHPGTKWAEMGLNQIAWTYYKAKSYANAETEFSKLIANYPESVSADDWQFMLGKIRYDNKNYALAIIQFEKIIIIFSSLFESIKKNKVSEAQLMIPKCKLEQGNYSPAISDFQDFISDNPNGRLVKEALIGIGSCYYRQGNDYYEDSDFSSAQASLDNAINIYENNKRKYILVNDVFPNVYFLKAEILIQQGDKEKAKTILEELIRDFGMSPISDQAKTKLEEL